jgi:diaminohydroxyphosphoribosylaminopyrimidine deaminase/5-amino-6-(5-phosphoribosylamino)uracil reductase
LNVFDQTVETLVFNEIKTDIEGKNKYIALEDFDRFVPQYILFQLYLQDLQSVIIEGGAYTLKTFIDAGLWDEARIFTGASVLENGIEAPVVTGATIVEHAVGTDSLQIITNLPI